VRVLIVNGVSRADDLTSFGLSVAERFSDADCVVGILGGKEFPLKQRKPSDTEVMYVDYLDVTESKPSLSRVAEICARVKKSYEQSHPRTAHLAHAFVGHLIFYHHLMDSTGHPRFGIEMLMLGDVDSFEQLAEDFIQRDFGGEGMASGKIISHGVEIAKPQTA